MCNELERASEHTVVLVNVESCNVTLRYESVSECVCCGRGLVCSTCTAVSVQQMVHHMCYYAIVCCGAGSINTSATASTEPTKRDKFKSFCMCQWLISCFKRDETTPVDTIPQDHTSPEVSNLPLYCTGTAPLYCPGLGFPVRYMEIFLGCWVFGRDPRVVVKSITGQSVWLYFD